jgi:hypothetical protein
MICYSMKLTRYGSNFRFALFVILLSVLLCSSSESQVIFRDEFHGEKSSAWKERNDGSRPGKFAIGNGTYTISSDDPVDSIPRALIQGIPTTNSYIQADVEIHPIDRNYASAALISYYADGDHFYEFSLDELHQYWSLQRVDKLGVGLLARGLLSKNRKLHRLGLYIKDKDVRAFVDGIMVAQKTDNRILPGGSLGLSARGAQAIWKNVVVRLSNPLDFFYKFDRFRTGGNGAVRIKNLTLIVVNDRNQPINGIEVFAIQRDALSYFVVHDPLNRYQVRSGFLTEFQQTAKEHYSISLTRSGNPARHQHEYTAIVVEWLLSFLHRSARYSSPNFSVDLSTQRPLYVRGGTVFLEDNPISDSVLGRPEQAIELNRVSFGFWEQFGNYAQFPSVSGAIRPSSNLLSSLLEGPVIPENSKFTLYTLKLNGSSTSVLVSWFVQEDSRANVSMERIDFPGQLKAGSSYHIPFTVTNTGEAAGPFLLSIVLSQNSVIGTNDVLLRKLEIDGVAAGAKFESQAEINIPANQPSGRYFLGTLLQPKNRSDGTLRLQNFINNIRAVTVGDLPAPGQLEITLSWDVPADLDLHVTDPFGETIYYFHPRSLTGGVLESDGECQSGATTERVTYPSGTAPAGNYIISLHYFRHCGAAREAHWRIEVHSDKNSQAFSGKIQSGEFFQAGEFVR